MKRLVPVVAALVLTLPSATASTGGVIDIRATIVAERVNAEKTRRSISMRLWNRAASRVPIGDSFVSCLVVGNDDRAHAVWGCNAVYRLPRGQIVTSGIATTLDNYTLAITGGTDLYVGQGGTTYTYRLGPGTYRVLMRLVP